MPAFHFLEKHLWSWVMSHGSFLKKLDLCLTCGSYICGMHILRIRILRQFFCPQFFFSKPPTQNFENWFSPKCVGKIFFRSRIRKQRKISRQMIYGDIRFIPPTPTQKELYICEILWRPRINKVPFEGLILLPSCSEGSITQEKSLIECVKPWKYRKVMFLSWKLLRPSSFL